MSLSNEPRYIQRNPATGEVLGHFAHPHPYAQEQVPEDHADIRAWNAKRRAEKTANMERKARQDPELMLARIEALEALLADRGA